MGKKKIGKTIAIFEQKEVRRVWHDEQWYFVIIDVVSALTDSVQPDGYIKDMRRRDEELSKGWGQIATPLEINTKGGKQKINMASVKGVFRIIQSIPSPKAEPFKLWLAKVGQERIEEIQDPERAILRGKIAGNTRKQIEKETGKKVMTKANFLQNKIKKLKKNK